MLTLKKYLHYIAIFFLIAIFLFANIYFNRVDKVNAYLQTQTKLFLSEYKTIYKSFQNLANNTFYGIINKKNIIDIYKQTKDADELKLNQLRTDLYNEFINDYERLREFNFHQLHFHLTNNHSFLRMHKPKLYGDDLSDIRFSIKYVNENLKPIDGFEMGRVVHGFRFVYPMFDENLNHLGSVESSVSANYFKSEFERNFDADIHFLVSKKVVLEKAFDKFKSDYVVSTENKNYLEYTLLTKSQANTSHIDNSDFSTSLYNDIEKNMLQDEAFSVFDKIDGNYKVLSFIPIFNIEKRDKVAYIVAYQDSEFLKSIESGFVFQIVVSMFILIVFILFMYRIEREKEKNKVKDMMLSQQTKMAAMGEMIGNIAHQWRQPLSAISTAASGVKLQKEFGILEDKVFIDSMDGIVRNSMYLSQTIDDFRNFFRDTKEISQFNINSLFEEVFNIFGASLANNNILILKNIEDINVLTYKNELKQALVNIIKNAKDAIKKDGIIHINAHKKAKDIIIEIKDSGGGIAKEILPNIFDPYFTTKHKSQGTGIGLYMTYQIVVEHLMGEIEVENSVIDYDFKSFSGAKFTIKFSDLHI